MEKNRLCEGIIAQMMNQEAWSNVSCRVAFSEAQLERFSDKVDWERVSENPEILWTASMLEKFKNKLNWSKLATSINECCVNVELLEKFKDYWDWNEFSCNSAINMNIINTFVDRLNWKNLINNYRVFREQDCEAFMKKYEDYIPAGSFKDSNLWQEIIEQKEKEVISKLCSI